MKNIWHLQLPIFAWICGFVFCSSIPLKVNAAPQGTDNSATLEQGAPENCLAYLCWTGWQDFDVERSLTEKWLSQPEMLRSFAKVKSELLGLAHRNLPETDAKRLDFSVGLVLQLIERPSSICLYEFKTQQLERFEDATANLICNLGEEAEATRVRIDRLFDEWPELQRTLKKIGGGDFWKVQLEGGVEFYYGFDSQHLIVASNIEAIERWQVDRQSPVPRWIIQQREQYGVEHITGMIMFDLASLSQWLIPNLDPGVQQYCEELGLWQAQRFVANLGVERQGSVMRGGLRWSPVGQGIFELFDKVQSVESIDLAGVQPNSDQIHLLQLPVDRLFDFVRSKAGNLQYEDPLVEPIGQVLDETGVDLDAIAKSLSGRLLLYGSLTPPFIQRGWVGSLGIKDSEKFNAQFDSLLRYLETREEIRVSSETRDGQVIYQFQAGESLYVSKSTTEMVITANRRSLTKYWKRVEQAQDSNLPDNVGFADDSTFTKLMTDPIFGDRRFILASSIDFRPYIEFALPVMSLVLSESIPGTDLSLEDAPPVSALTNYMEPSLYAIYKSEQGIDFYYQQTAPFLSPGVSTPIVIGLLLPAVQAARAAARRTQSGNNLRNIYLAMASYKAVHGHYPARYSSGKNGEMLLSWRVHLLPYLGYKDLYAKFKLEEAWNSDHNQLLLKEMPAVYSNPNIQAKAGETSYLILGDHHPLVGAPSAASTVETPLAIEPPNPFDSQTPLMVDVANLVSWTKPEDASPDDRLLREHIRELRATGGVNVLRVDGTVEFVPNSRIETLNFSIWKK